MHGRDNTMRTKCCAECGERYSPGRKSDTAFCSKECRQSFNNRRLQRGAELYDLFMTMRYERGIAKTYGIWTLICKMAFVWREEDRVERNGRDSFRSFPTIKDRFSRYHAVTLQRSRRQAD